MSPKSSKKPAKARAAAKAPSSNINITYTIRTIPRATWERFAKRLKDDGRSIEWAMQKFVSTVADGQFKFE